jgi:hypothetical protein
MSKANYKELQMQSSKAQKPPGKSLLKNARSLNRQASALAIVFKTAPSLFPYSPQSGFNFGSAL